MRKFTHTLKRIFSDKGLLLTLFLSLALLLFFYGKLLLHPCTTYFGSRGDGMQIYYETLYHIKFDKDFWRQTSINYPYGESIFFTGAMPFINNLVKIFGPSAAPYGVGLINLLMLFSPVIGALFIYAIFRHLRLPWHYAGVSASAIAFLSPQLGRFIGHYSLSWVFLIPAMLYLLLRFYDYPSLKKSFAIAFFVFLGATTHLYFLAFFLALGGFYWMALFFSRDRGFGRIPFVLKHFSVQFILPVAILETLIKLYDSVADRTNFPWGYLVFHSNKTGVFFPFNRPYEKLFGFFWKHSDVGFEGLAYVGLVAIIGLLAIVCVQLYKLVRLKYRLAFSVTDHKVLNIFFWTSLLLLWISFANPFLNGNEEWLLYLGPLKQFRAIGRFNWIFFYVMNIIAVYRLYKLSQRNKYLLNTILFFVPSMLMYDAYYTARDQQDSLNNHVVELQDEKNELPQDLWLKKFDATKYQAILPLPYFHVGSENLSREPHDAEIINCAYLVSLKTGLPMMGVQAARVSLSQTLKSLPIILDPIRSIPILKDLRDNRPLLLVVREDSLDINEKRILSLAKPISVSDNYKIFSILPSEIAQIPTQEYTRIKTKFDTTKKYQALEYLSSDSTPSFAYNTFNGANGKPYHGKGSYTGIISGFNTLYEGNMKVPGNYIASFWMNKINQDVYPRTQVEIYAYDTLKKKSPYYTIVSVTQCVKAIDGSWGLVEFPVFIPAAGSDLKITAWNYELKKSESIEVDDLLIRQEGTDFYNVSGDTIYFNNRTYFPQQ